MIAAGSHYCDIRLVVLSMRLLLVRLTMLELPLNFPTMSLWMVLKPPSRHSVEYGNTKDEFSTRLFQKTESVSVPMPCADRKLRICRSHPSHGNKPIPSPQICCFQSFMSNFMSYDRGMTFRR